MIQERRRLNSTLLLVAGLSVYFLLTARTLSQNDQLDFFIYRAGQAYALGGDTPYDRPRLQQDVLQTFPDASDFAHNCGFFLTTQAVLVFVPFAMISSWPIAQAVWFLLLTLAGIACGLLAWTCGRSRERHGTGAVLIVLAVLLNPVTQLSLVVGQTTLLFAGLIALGQFCFDHGRTSLGCLLWAMTFFKPHLALPFLLLALACGGWKRFLTVAVMVLVLNVLGTLLARGTLGGTISLFREYVKFISAGREQVRYNLVAENFQITSWNRVVVSAGGPAIDLKISMTLAGFAIGALLTALRLRLKAGSWRDAYNRIQSNSAYLLAMTAAGTMVFAQALAYELILLVLVSPLIVQAVDVGQRRYALVLIVLLLSSTLIPISLSEQIADFCKLEEQSRSRTLLRSHKCFVVAGLWLYMLICGPCRCLTGPLIPSRDSRRQPK